MSRWAGHFRGFTLVELLVVIGIIVILIGVLLPVLSGVAARGRDLNCQSNIRQTVQLILTYAAENKGQLPYGDYFVKGGGPPDGWGPASGADLATVNLWSVVSQMTSTTRTVEDFNYDGTDEQRAHAVRNAAPVLRCPEAMLVLPHLASYSGNMAAFISPFHDGYAGARRNGPPWQRLVERPTTVNRCFPITALVWDTVVLPGMATKMGYIIGADIDGQRIWLGAIYPQYRYFSPADPFGRISPGIYGNNRPVVMSVMGTTWRNIDPPPNRFDHFGDMAHPPYLGNLRFRHNRQTTCNVGFADGSVGKYIGKFKSNGEVISHNAIRKHFMVKWPSGMGITPYPALPH